MVIDKTQVFVFNRSKNPLERLELFIRMAITHGTRCLVIAGKEEALALRKILMSAISTDTDITIIRNDVKSLRTNFPEQTAVFVHPQAGKSITTLVCSKALRSRLGVTYVS